MSTGFSRTCDRLRKWPPGLWWRVGAIAAAAAAVLIVLRLRGLVPSLHQMAGTGVFLALCVVWVCVVVAAVWGDIKGRWRS